MNSLSIVIGLFVLLESLNILILYFLPSSKKGNGVGVFNAFEKSKSDPEIHNFIKYLINWVAGSKLIFITLLVVIFLNGDETLQLHSVIALILSIATFFWKLYPLLKSMDSKKELIPFGYSKTLLFMIISIISALLISLIYYFIEITKV